MNVLKMISNSVRLKEIYILNCLLSIGSKVQNLPMLVRTVTYGRNAQSR